MLIQTVQGIANQQDLDGKCELHIVSQTPETSKLVLAEDYPQISLKVHIVPESGTISASRNHGAKHSNADYLAFLDADIALEPGWASKMITLLKEKPECAIVSGMQECTDNAPVMEKLRTSLSNMDTDHYVAFLPGCNLFMRQQIFHQVGGFPEHLRTCEDYFFTDSATRFGKLYTSSHATYLHLGEDKSYQQMFSKEIWRGQSNLQGLQGRKFNWRELPSLVVPVGVCMTMLVGLLLLLLAHYGLAAGAFTCAALPILAYSVRLYKRDKRKVGLPAIMWFYSCYFVARAIGTLIGTRKQIISTTENNK